MRLKQPAGMHTPADLHAAQQLSQGRVLIPYWGRNKQGVRVALSCWDTLRPGENLMQATQRLSAQQFF